LRFPTRSGQEELQRLTQEAGFSDVEVRVHRLDVHCRVRPVSSSIIWRERRVRAIHCCCGFRGAQTNWRRSVTKELQQYADATGVTIPEENSCFDGSGPLTGGRRRQQEASMQNRLHGFAL